MVLIACLLSTGLIQKEIVPTFWMDTTGVISVNGQELEPRSSEGVQKVKSPYGIGYDFSGAKGGVLFDDLRPLKLDKNLTIAAYLFPREYAPNGAQSQIFFRGDDRNGFDPYSLLITKEGNLEFQITEESGKTTTIQSPVILNHWTFVVASFNSVNGEMTLYENGAKVTSATSPFKPFVDLLPQYKPGFSVGNVQNNKGPHNQPFHGVIADIRVYDKTLTPSQIGFRPTRLSTGPQP